MDGFAGMRLKPCDTGFKRTDPTEDLLAITADVYMQLLQLVGDTLQPNGKPYKCFAAFVGTLQAGTGNHGDD